MPKRTRPSTFTYDVTTRRDGRREQWAPLSPEGGRSESGSIRDDASRPGTADPGDDAEEAIPPGSTTRSAVTPRVIEFRGLELRSAYRDGTFRGRG